MTKLVVALDAFKGGASAPDTCGAVAEGLRGADPSLELVLKPMADGGEGTAAALLSTLPEGEWVSLSVSGSLPGQRQTAGYAWFARTQCAVVEMAAANGLPLLRSSERDPLQASTLGTGELIRAAAARGAKRILLAIGGSATIDGGTGAALALGWRFLDANGNPVVPGGAGLRDIADIRPPASLNLPPVIVLSDVSNPLCGPQGAAAVFGPQKGATPETIPLLDAGLRNLARVIRHQFDFDIDAIPGAGAAGGLGGGAAVFLNATVSPGIDTMMKVCGLAEALQGADWLVTGEGSFDAQSLQGKVVSGVARYARAANVPTVVLAGCVGVEPDVYRRHGIVEALATHAADLPMDEVLRHEMDWLRQTAARWWLRVSQRDL